jgi:hypothetical protein
MTCVMLPMTRGRSRTSAEAIEWLIKRGHECETISLDHDLGGEDTTRPVVLWMCENICPKDIRVHTANPVGRDWLEGMINRCLINTF